MARVPSQSNSYNAQPYYGNVGGMSRLAAMGAQAGSPYFSFTGRPNINQSDVMSALQSQFGSSSSSGGGGMFPGLTGRGMYASGQTSSESMAGGGGGADPSSDPSSIWFNNWQGYQEYKKAQAAKLTSSGQPWLDPTSEWYGNEEGYRNYNTEKSRMDLGALTHPGWVYDAFTKQWHSPSAFYYPGRGWIEHQAGSGLPVAGPPVSSSGR
jgi:hypothetical protein